MLLHYVISLIKCSQKIALYWTLSKRTKQNNYELLDINKTIKFEDSYNPYASMLFMAMQLLIITLKFN